jgi:hypothetical protein
MLTISISGTDTDLVGVGGTSLGSKALGLGAGLGLKTVTLRTIGTDGAGDLRSFKRAALPMAAFLLMPIFRPIAVKLMPVLHSSASLVMALMSQITNSS